MSYPFAVGEILKAIDLNALVGAGRLVTRDLTQLIADTTLTTVTYTATPFSSGLIHSAGITTVDADGLYLVTGFVRWDASSTGYRQAQITLGGTLPTGQIAVPARQGGHAMVGTSNNGNNVSAICALNDTNTARVDVIQTSGAALNVTAAQLGVYKLRPLVTA